MSFRDISHAIETGMPVYPGDPTVTVDPVSDYEETGFRVCSLELGTHSGTHVDAPSHFVESGETLGCYDVDTFSFDARLVDIQAAPREPIGLDSMPESTDHDLLVIATGWDRHWTSKRYRDHPYITEAVADWCVDHDFHLAVDFLSPDPTPTPNASADEPTDFPVHRRVLGAGNLIFENFTNLHGLPERLTVHAYPLNVDADGAPVRAVAKFSK